MTRNTRSSANAGRRESSEDEITPVNPSQGSAVPARAQRLTRKRAAEDTDQTGKKKAARLKQTTIKSSKQVRRSDPSPSDHEQDADEAITSNHRLQETEDDPLQPPSNTSSPKKSKNSSEESAGNNIPARMTSQKPGRDTQPVRDTKEDIVFEKDTLDSSDDDEDNHGDSHSPKSTPDKNKSKSLEEGHRASEPERAAYVEAEVSAIREQMGAMQNDIKSMLEVISTSAMFQAKAEKNVKAEEEKEVVVHSVRPMQKYREVMSSEVLYLEHTFSVHTISRCLMHVVFVTMGEIPLTDSKEMIPTGFLEFLNVLHFSLKNNEKKEKNLHGHGPKASILRRRCAIATLTACQRDTFGMFKRDGVQEDEDDDGEDRPKKPHWLRKTSDGKALYIEKRHILLAQKDVDMKSEDRGKRFERADIGMNGECTGRDEQALYAMRSFFSLLRKHLNESRKRGPERFFEMIGYLLADWSKEQDVIVSQDSLEMAWMTRPGEVDSPDDNEFPKAVFYGDRDRKALRKNEELFGTFADTRTEVMILVKHDVIVKTKGKQNAMRARRGDKQRSWERVINLMDVVMYWLHGYAQMETGSSVLEVLGTHRNSIKFIYRASLLLRQVLSALPDHHINNPIMPESAREDSQLDENAHRSVNVCEEDAKNIISLLTPSASIMGRSIVKITCCVSNSLFEKHKVKEKENAPGGEGVENSQEGSIGNLLMSASTPEMETGDTLDGLDFE